MVFFLFGFYALVSGVDERRQVLIDSMMEDVGRNGGKCTCCSFEAKF